MEEKSGEISVDVNSVAHRVTVDYKFQSVSLRYKLIISHGQNQNEIINISPLIKLKMILPVWLLAMISSFIIAVVMCAKKKKMNKKTDANGKPIAPVSRLGTVVWTWYFKIQGSKRLQLRTGNSSRGKSDKPMSKRNVSKHNPSKRNTSKRNSKRAGSQHPAKPMMPRVETEGPVKITEIDFRKLAPVMPGEVGECTVGCTVVLGTV